MKINGLQIKEYRKKHNLTQSDFAKLLGVSFRTIQNYEAGGAIPKSKHEILNTILHKEYQNYYSENNSENEFNEEPLPNYSSILTKLNNLIKKLEAIENPDINDLKNLKDAYDLRTEILEAQ